MTGTGVDLGVCWGVGVSVCVCVRACVWFLACECECACVWCRPPAFPQLPSAQLLVPSARVVLVCVCVCVGLVAILCGLCPWRLLVLWLLIWLLLRLLQPEVDVSRTAVDDLGGYGSGYHCLCVFVWFLACECVCVWCRRPGLGLLRLLHLDSVCDLFF